LRWVVGITFHEFSHAFVADQLGDHQPRAQGRVSLNPARHIEPMGALFFVIAGFGWGKPVMVNSYALRPAAHRSVIRGCRRADRQRGRGSRLRGDLQDPVHGRRRQ